MSGVSKYSSFTPAGSPSWIVGLVPNWQGGTFDGWRHVKSVYALDFVDGRAMSGASEALIETCLTTMRASPVYLESDDGTYRKFEPDTLAMMDAKGVFIGGQFTNKIRNPRGEGGVVGTVGVTNKCTGYNAAPPALVAMGTAAAFNLVVTNISASGGDANTLFGVVDDTAALQAIAASDPFIQAGLTNGWLNGRVYKIDNSSGAVEAIVSIGGVSGNTNMHSAQAYVRGGDGYILIYPRTVGSPSVFASSASYVERKIANVVPTTVGVARVAAYAGSTIYFILFDLIEATTAAPVPTVVAGASATGALPPNESVANAVGLGVCYLGSNTKDGLPYQTIRAKGTTTSAAALDIRPESSTHATAAVGQAWGHDYWVEKVAGTVPDFKSAILAYASGSTLATFASGTAVTPTATRQQATTKDVVAAGTTDNVRASIQSATLTDATDYDFTVNIYAPKLAQLAAVSGAAGYMPAYPILPPIGVPGDSVRVGDVVRAVANDTQPFSRWEAAGLSERASVIVSLDLFHVGEGKARPLFEISDGSLDNYVRAFLNDDDQATLEIVAGGVVQASVALTAAVAVGTSLFVCTWTADGGYICDDGGQVASVPSVALPAGLTHMQVGGSLTITYLNDTVRQIQACLPLTQSEAAFWTQMV